VGGLDAVTAARVRPAVAWLAARSGSDQPGVAAVAAFLRRELP
jgi:hypothetical protein